MPMLEGIPRQTCFADMVPCRCFDLVAPKQTRKTKDCTRTILAGVEDIAACVG